VCKKDKETYHYINFQGRSSDNIKSQVYIDFKVLTIIESSFFLVRIFDAAADEMIKVEKKNLTSSKSVWHATDGFLFSGQLKQKLMDMRKK
jgi:hypothetical protein